VVRTIDLAGCRRVRGWFPTKSSALVAAERWEQEGRWRAEIGFRFATVLAGLVPDRELHVPIAVPASSQPVKPRRRPASVPVDGVVAGRLPELVELLIARLARDEALPRVSVGAGMPTAPSQGKAA